MRPWREGERPNKDRGKRPAEPEGQAGGAESRPSLMDEISERRASQVRGDEAEQGRHRHGDTIHSHLDPHPHNRGATSPTIGIVGAGAVGTALGLAIHRAGWPVPAFATRDDARGERFRSLVPGARRFLEPAAILDEVELAILAVPDDAIPDVAESMRLYSGQALVHTSGLLGAEVLESAVAAGSQVGAFHPLVSFTSDVEASVEAIKGATIALDAGERLLGLLADLAEAIGGIPVRLPRGTKAAYHAAAVLASGGVVALLDAIVALGRVAGLDEHGALAVYGRLTEQTIANARRHGVTDALTGPIARGDVGTLEAHLAALRKFSPEVVDIYIAVARREVEIATRRGALAPEAAARVAAVLAKPR